MLRTAVPNLVALVSGFGWHVQDLHRAAEALNFRLNAISFPRVVGQVGTGTGRSRVEAGGIDLGQVDGVLVRMMPPGSLEQVVFRMDALHRLEALGVPVLNPPRAVEVAVDKYLALARLDAAGLPVPPTWTGESAAEALAAFEWLGGDVVIKPLFGSEGRGLVRVSDLELARRTFHTLERLGAVIYVQAAIRHPGYDLRAFVLGGQIVGAIRRHAPGADWRTNVSLGGRPELCSLEPEAERLALSAAKAVGTEMAGIDLLPDLDRGRLLVLEVNAVPGWRALAGTTGVDVASEILLHLKAARR
ncbi:ribosomal protein S6--L-glutamate ligase [Singulisphaera sp. GP187]|uniref:ATP-grasp domain-containing protein n=1 Tax=Singulisphaera sp. GP187 TaxID=1882752 RepID=UPI0009261B40|nr:RimK family alpha-L-glutamate ligase [Singulisphaera sp. GP187]SIO65986.1 ribosomal protein S6--L-glutamate ligase [Singulisphaera sp. GP187]